MVAFWISSSIEEAMYTRDMCWKHPSLFSRTTDPKTPLVLLCLRGWGGRCVRLFLDSMLWNVYFGMCTLGSVLCNLYLEALLLRLKSY